MFCSLGNPPFQYSSSLVNALIFNGNGDYKYRSVRSQTKDSTACGYFCLWFADLRCRGFTFEDCMDKLSKTDLVGNELSVIDYVDNHMRPQRLPFFFNLF